MVCEARQYSDQMSCGRCGLAWDMNDPDPPTCAPRIDRRVIPDRRKSNEVRRLESTIDLSKPWAPSIGASIPSELPPIVAADMARAYEAQASANGSPVDAMRAAYRVFMGSLP